MPRKYLAFDIETAKSCPRISLTYLLTGHSALLVRRLGVAMNPRQ